VNRSATIAAVPPRCPVRRRPCRAVPGLHTDAGSRQCRPAPPLPRRTPACRDLTLATCGPEVARERSARSGRPCLARDARKQITNSPAVWRFADRQDELLLWPAGGGYISGQRTAISQPLAQALTRAGLTYKAVHTQTIDTGTRSCSSLATRQTIHRRARHVGRLRRLASAGMGRCAALPAARTREQRERAAAKHVAPNHRRRTGPAV
jgi:hypothetical protein